MQKGFDRPFRLVCLHHDLVATSLAAPVLNGRRLVDRLRAKVQVERVRTFWFSAHLSSEPSQGDHTRLEQIEPQTPPDEPYRGTVPLASLPADLLCQVLIELHCFDAHPTGSTENQWSECSLLHIEDSVDVMVLLLVLVVAVDLVEALDSPVRQCLGV